MSGQTSGRGGQENSVHPSPESAPCAFCDKEAAHRVGTDTMAAGRDLVRTCGGHSTEAYDVVEFIAADFVEAVCQDDAGAVYLGRVSTALGVDTDEVHVDGLRRNPPAVAIRDDGMEDPITFRTRAPPAELADALQNSLEDLDADEWSVGLVHAVADDALEAARA